MELRFSERHIVALNFLLVVVAAYFAALTVNDVVLARLALPTGAPLSAASRAHVVPGAHSRSYYQPIIERDIFNLTPQAAGPAPVVAENLRLRLLGISQLTSGRPFAIIEDRSGQQSLYRLGDAIPGVGRLLVVEEDRAVVEHHGRRVALELPRNELPGPVVAPGGLSIPAIRDHAAAQAPTSDDFDPDVSDLGDNRYAIPRATVDHGLSHLSELFTQIRAVPNIQNGRTTGFALSEIEPGSVFDEMGLEDGDVITTVDGQRVNDPTQAMQMLNLLRDRSSIGIRVLREGKPVNLNYEIR